MTGDEFRSIRKASKLTQVQLATRFGRAPQTICQWETGVQPIREETAMAMKRLRDEAAGQFTP